MCNTDGTCTKIMTDLFVLIFNHVDDFVVDLRNGS